MAVDQLTTTPTVLDLGCGACKTPGAIGIDYRACEGVDVVHNLDEFPWPLEDNTFDEVISNGSIEMLENLLKTMDEIHRIMKPGGRFKITTTHFAAWNSYWDPHQKHRFGYFSFDWCCEGYVNPIYTEHKYRMITREASFTRTWGLGQLLFKISPRRFDKYYAYRHPPHRMYFELEVVK